MRRSSGVSAVILRTSEVGPENFSEFSLLLSLRDRARYQRRARYVFEDRLITQRRFKVTPRQLHMLASDGFGARSLALFECVENGMMLFLAEGQHPGATGQFRPREDHGTGRREGQSRQMIHRAPKHRARRKLDQFVMKNF